MAYGRGQDVDAPKFDSDDVPQNNIPRLTNGSAVDSLKKKKIGCAICMFCEHDGF